MKSLLHTESVKSRCRQCRCFSDLFPKKHNYKIYTMYFIRPVQHSPLLRPLLKIYVESLAPPFIVTFQETMSRQKMRKSYRLWTTQYEEGLQKTNSNFPPRLRSRLEYMLQENDDHDDFYNNNNHDASAYYNNFDTTSSDPDRDPLWIRLPKKHQNSLSADIVSLGYDISDVKTSRHASSRAKETAEEQTGPVSLLFAYPQGNLLKPVAKLESMVTALMDKADEGLARAQEVADGGITFLEKEIESASQTAT